MVTKETVADYTISSRVLTLEIHVQVATDCFILG